MADMDQSLRDSLNQLINIQSQQVTAINNLANMSNNMITNQRIQQTVNSSTSVPQYTSSYTNFAPDYQANAMPFAPIPGVFSQQQAQQQIMQSGQPKPPGFIESVFVNTNRTSRASANQMIVDYSGRAASGAATAAQGFAGIAGGIGGSFLTSSLLPGLALGTAGGLAAGGVVGIAADQIKQQAAYNSFLNRESYRFINTLESQNPRDIAGFSRRQRYEAADFLRGMGTEERITDQETMMLLQKFTEGGLLKEVKDVETFKDKMKELTKFVKTSALMLNESFEDVSQLMSDMKKIGIDTQNFEYLSSRSKVLGAFTGKDAGQIMTSIQGLTTGMNQGTAYSNTFGMERMQDTMLYMNQLYTNAKQGKDTNPIMGELFNYITNIGGIEQATGVAAQFQRNLFETNAAFNIPAINFFDYDEKSGGFKFNQTSFNDYITGNKNANELSQDAQRKISRLSTPAQNEWMRNSANYIFNSLGEESLNKLTSRNLNALQAVSGNPDILGKDLSTREQLSLLLGENSQDARMFAEFLDFYNADEGNLRKTMAEKSRQQTRLAEMNAQRKGFAYEITSRWEGFKDYVGDKTSPVVEGAESLMEGLSDWWYGKEYTIKDIAKGRDFSAAGMRRERDNDVKAVTDAKKSLENIRGLGYNVSDELIEAFDIDEADIRKTKENIINYKREVFESLDDISEGIKGFGEQMRESSEKYGVSETYVARMLEMGTGKDYFMGFDVAKQRSMGIYDADPDDKVDAIVKELGKLTGQYGGNQDLALAALFSSIESIDEAIRKSYGVDPNKLREEGRYNEFNNIDINEVKNYTPDEVNEAINNIITAGSDVAYDPTVKLKNKNKSYHEKISRLAEQTGLSPNFIASMIATESEGENIQGPQAYGPMQLTPNWVKARFWNKDTGWDKITIGGEEIQLTENNWRTDEDINIAIGAMGNAMNLEASRGNPFVMDTMHNAGVGSLKWIKQWIKNEGAKSFKDLGIDVNTEEGMNQAIERIGYGGADDPIGYKAIQQALILYGDENSNKPEGEKVKNVKRFHGKYNLGIKVPEKRQGVTKKEDVYVRPDGTTLTPEEIKESREDNALVAVSDVPYLNVNKLRETYSDYIEGLNELSDDLGFDISQGLTPAQEKELGIKMKGPQVTKGLNKIRKELTVNLAESLNIKTKDESGKSKSQSKLQSELTDRYIELHDILNEFDEVNKSGGDIKKTKWYQMTTADKVMTWQTLKYMNIAFGEDDKEVRPGYKLNDYLSKSDIETMRKTGFIGIPGLKEFKTVGVFGEGDFSGWTSGLLSGELEYGAGVEGTDAMYFSYIMQNKIPLPKDSGKTHSKYEHYGDVMEDLKNEVEEIKVKKDEAYRESNKMRRDIKTGKINLDEYIRSTTYSDAKPGYTYTTSYEMPIDSKKFKKMVDIMLDPESSIKDREAATRYTLDLKNKIYDHFKYSERDPEKNDLMKFLNNLGKRNYELMTVDDTAGTKLYERLLRDKEKIDDVGAYSLSIMKDLGVKKENLDYFRKHYMTKDKGGGIDIKYEPISKILNEDYIIQSKKVLADQIAGVVTAEGGYEKFSKVIDSKGFGAEISLGIKDDMFEMIESGKIDRKVIDSIVDRMLNAMDESPEDRSKIKDKVSKADMALNDLEMSHKKMIDQIISNIDHYNNVTMTMAQKQEEIRKQLRILDPDLDPEKMDALIKNYAGTGWQP